MKFQNPIYIVCYCQNKVVKMAAVAKKWCVTDPVVETVVFDWTIENALSQCYFQYGFCDEENGTPPFTSYVRSKEFASKNNRWSLKLYRHKENIVVMIELSHTDRHAYVVATCRFSVGKNFEYSREDGWHFTHSDDFDDFNEPDWKRQCVHGFTDFISFDEIKQYICGSQLTVRCELRVFAAEHHIDSESTGITIPEGSLARDMKDLLQGGSNSDVILLAEDREFKAHRNILSARSPVFAGMFGNDMQESATGRVDIPDIKAEVLQELLTYIYTDDCPALVAQGNVVDKARELLYAADKYQLTRLKALCEKELTKTIGVASVAETLLYANMHNAHQLEQTCIRFIIAKRLEVSTTPAWKHVKEHHGLYNAILCKQAETEEESAAKRPRLS